MSGDSFMGMRAHYIDDDKDITTDRVIGCERFPAPHTAIVRSHP